jgi:HTH-like domain
MRFRFIEDRRADYPVTIMCDVLGVSSAGCYAWRARAESPRAAANRELVDDIKRVHRDTNGRYNSPRIHAELRAQGRGASRGRIERLMRGHGIRAITARPRRVRTTDAGPIIDYRDRHNVARCRSDRMVNEFCRSMIPAIAWIPSTTRLMTTCMRIQVKSRAGAGNFSSKQRNHVRRAARQYGFRYIQGCDSKEASVHPRHQTCDE